MSIFVLKLIAIITMFIDHTGVVFANTNPAVMQWFRVVGRISFPIFAFMIAEGCRYTRNITKYFGRLLLYGLMIQAALAGGTVLVKNVWGIEPVGLSFINIFFTLSLGVMAITGLKMQVEGQVPPLFADLTPGTRQVLGTLFFALPLFLAGWLKVDYGVPGVMIIVFFYVGGTSRAGRVSAGFAGILFLYGLYLAAPMNTTTFWMPFSALLTLILFASYNGKPGPVLPKPIFYAMYPLSFILPYAVLLAKGGLF